MKTSYGLRVSWHVKNIGQNGIIPVWDSREFTFANAEERDQMDVWLRAEAPALGVQRFEKHDRPASVAEIMSTCESARRIRVNDPNWP